MEKKEPGVMASMSCMGYGYKVKVRVNGADVGVVGGKSESKRLLSPTHEMAAQMPPDMRKQFAVLKDGENRFEIEFRKTGGPNDRLTFEVFLEDPDPVFSVESSAKAAGKVDRTIDLAKPSPVKITDADIR